MKRFILMFLSWVIIFSLMLFGVFYIRSNTSGTISPSDIPVNLDDVEKPNENIMFVLMGVDAKDDETAYGQRTDTIMICKYFNNTKKLAIMSIPRDTLINIPGHGREKINHAHAYGGPELTLKTINEGFDLDIEYYVRVDYDVVKDVVDAVNGVEVDVPVDMKYEDPYSDPPLKINIKKGVQVLDGKKSLEFLRFRSGYVEQDLGRIKAQQAFIKSLLEKAKNPIYLLKAPFILKSTSENISTNISVTKILSYVTAIGGISSENMQVETLPVEPIDIDGISYVKVISDQVDDVFHDLFEKSTVTKKDNSEEEGAEGSDSSEGNYETESTEMENIEAVN